MKRTMRMLLVMALCLMLAVPAFAEPVVVRDNIKDDLRVVYGCELLTVRGRDGYALQTIDGLQLTDAIYSNVTYDKGYITAANATLEGNNVFGIMSKSGKEIAPFKYGNVDIQGSWGVCIVLLPATADQYDFKSWSGDSFYSIDTVDIYYLPEGALKATLSRANFLDSEAVGDYLNVQDRATNVITTYDTTFTAVGTVDNMYDDDHVVFELYRYESNGQRGFQDAQGNVVIPAAWKYVNDFVGDYCVVSTGSSEGLIDRAGNVVVPAEYNAIKRMSYLSEVANGVSYGYEAYGYACVEQDDKIGYVKAGGELTCPPKYSKKAVTVNGLSMTLTDLEGNLRILAADGVESIITGYANVNVADYFAGLYYRVTDDNGKYGVINWHGEVVLPCEYQHMTFCGDGQHILTSKDYKSYQIIKLDMPTGNAAPAAEASAEEAPAEDATAGNTASSLAQALSMLGTTGKAPQAAAPAEEAPAEAPVETPAEAPAAKEISAAEKNATLNLLNSAVTLLNVDPAGNATSVVALLNSAVMTLINSGNADVVNLLNTAVTLLSTDAATNGASAISLINTAIAMLK